MLHHRRYKGQSSACLSLDTAKLCFTLLDIFRFPLQQAHQNSMSENGNQVSKPTIEAPGETDHENDPVRSPVKLTLLLLSLCLAVLCQALDNTIITTAIPKITDEFNSLQDVGWYGYVRRKLSTEGSG